jgi:hypothetical protein
MRQYFFLFLVFHFLHSFDTFFLLFLKYFMDDQCKPNDQQKYHKLQLQRESPLMEVAVALPAQCVSLSLLPQHSMVLHVDVQQLFAAQSFHHCW